MASSQQMQELDQNGNPKNMSLVSNEFIWFKQGSVTNTLYK
ncbi:hypothetical protein F383_02712 [Gossypium arboreum]|uniref:Uncharacterized protein n=1 Tax=Gossypium arboreum TaxID=29729 RepID=A0A0B0PH44_GOSAR|nr:hypothetical protein F383_02712 [Gossypium arboreum]